MSAITRTPKPVGLLLADFLGRIEVPLPALGRPYGWVLATALGLPLLLGSLAGGAHALFDLSRSRAAHMARVADDDRMVETIAVLDALAALDASAAGRWGSYVSPTEGTVITKGETPVRLGDRVPDASAYAGVRVSTDRGPDAYPLVTLTGDAHRCRSIVYVLRTGPNASRVQVSRREGASSAAVWADVTNWQAASSACGARGPEGNIAFRIRP